MGQDVHIHVAFPCDDNDPVAALAETHLSRIPGPETYDGMYIDDFNEAKWFLQDLASRSGRNPGPKGGLSLWGVVGNYTDVEEFVLVLAPFWEDLFRLDESPMDFERVMVFEEIEQWGYATAYEISWDDGKLKIRKEKCNFSWGQY